MTFDQIEQLWVQNGGDPNWAPFMAGIAIAESGGNTQALNNTPATGDYSVGLWQINYFQSLAPGRTALYGSPTDLLADPNKQAKAAINLFGQNGAGIGNWANDSTAKAWVAAGRPQAPSAATVESWLGGDLGTTGDQVPAPGASDPSTATGSKAVGCGAKGGGISLGIGPISTGKLFNACQVKGIVGGLLVGLGGATIIVGVVILAGKSSSVRSAVGTVAGGIAGGPEGAAVGGAVAGAEFGVKPGQKSGQERREADAGYQKDLVDLFAANEDNVYDMGFWDGIAAALADNDQPAPKNTRQANKQAEALFDSLGISVAGPSSQKNSLGKELPF